MSTRLPSSGLWLAAPVCFLHPLSVSAQLSEVQDPDARVAEASVSAPEEEDFSEPDHPTPPILIWAPSVRSPDPAAGPAVVTLKVLINASGRVERAELVSGSEPYVGEARRAVFDFRFRPATLGGEPHSAYVLIELEFAEQSDPDAGTGAPGQPQLAVAPSGAALDSGPPSAPTSEAPEAEVAVSGVRKPASIRVVSDEETRIIPGAEGDPLRAIEALPGTVPVLASGPFLGIRGAAGGMVGYEYDGISVPYLFHLARGSAVVHPFLVDSAALYATGGPARLGRSGGGFFEAQAAEPSGRLRAQGRVRATDAALGVEVPFADGRGSVLAAGRYSYTAGLVSLVAPKFSLDYWDYQARLRYRTSAYSYVEVLTLGAGDRSAQQGSDGSFDDLFHGSFHRVAVRFQRTTKNGNRYRIAATYGHDRWDGNASPYHPTAHLLGLRAERATRLSPRSELTFGADLLSRFQLDQYVAVVDAPVESYERTDLSGGTWVDWVSAPTQALTVSLGVRLDAMASSETPVSPEDGAFALQPREALSYQLTPALRLHQSTGVSAQPRSPAQRPPGRMAGAAGGFEHTWLSDVGLEVRLPGAVTFDCTAFQNTFFHVGDIETLRTLAGQPTDLDRGQGRALGLELSLRRTLARRLRGFISYTLSRSERSVGRVTSLAQYDRPHVLDVALAYDFGKGWGISSRGTLYSGFPARVQTVEQAQEEIPRSTAYYQIDVQGEKRFKIGQQGSYLAVTLGILNMTLNQEANDFVCSPQSCQEQLVGPATIPTIGIEGEL